MAVVRFRPRNRPEPEPECRACAWNGLLFWIVPPGGSRVDEAERFHQRLRRLREEWGSHVGAVVVVEPSAWVPSEEELEAFEAMLTDMASDISIMAVVLEGHDLRPVLLHKVLEQTFNREPRPFPIRIFQDLREASAWTAPLTLNARGSIPDPRELIAIVNGLRDGDTAD